MFAKILVLFITMEYALVALPLPLGGLNLFHLLHEERERLPISTLPPADEALDVGNLEAMLASHVVSRPKAPNEFRVLVLGDSAAWGLQLTPDETVTGQLNQSKLRCGNKDVRVYNLSYPRSSATKDLMILDKARATQPDMIVWFITWYTLMPKTRADHWLISQNPGEYYALARRFDFLPKDYRPPGLWDRVFDANRRLFRVARYELYAAIQVATGQDQMPGPPEVLPANLSPDPSFEGLKPPTLREAQVSLDQVEDFHTLAGNVPVLLVNEPILVVVGDPNSSVRYNNYYPRWVYDQYREYVQEAASRRSWNYLDLWNAFPSPYFTDTPLHLTPDGQHLLATMLAPAIEARCQ